LATLYDDHEYVKPEEEIQELIPAAFSFDSIGLRKRALV
jgi:hypothetical protein